jgi:hypothetical protein
MTYVGNVHVSYLLQVATHDSTLVGLGIKLSTWAIFVKYLVLGISGNAYLW